MRMIHLLLSVKIPSKDQQPLVQLSILSHSLSLFLAHSPEPILHFTRRQKYTVITNLYFEQAELFPSTTEQFRLQEIERRHLFRS